MRYPHLLRYLHEKPLPRNPLWNPGNPRHKIFLPLYWLRIVEHEKTLPKDFVKFECHWQMTKNDVKQYLEKLYEIPVLDVHVEIKKGEYMEHPKRPMLLSPPMEDRKFVYVQLKDGEFTFPDIFGEKNPSEEEKKQIKAVQSMKNREKNKVLDRLDIGEMVQNFENEFQLLLKSEQLHQKYIKEKQYFEMEKTLILDCLKKQAQSKITQSSKISNLYAQALNLEAKVEDADFKITNVKLINQNQLDFLLIFKESLCIRLNFIQTNKEINLTTNPEILTNLSTSNLILDSPYTPDDFTCLINLSDTTKLTTNDIKNTISFKSLFNFLKLFINPYLQKYFYEISG
ncbi:unnamed protein product [Brachionus calyciflorus]|uniref:Large ribosomal subunit protein uL23m n=1 Tax=Brachionus calyciflorus TaxID=104777 RepID=A0A813VUH1_9BILA|nr:unnamed protein product [Brachionus calyciflorus]